MRPLGHTAYKIHTHVTYGEHHGFHSAKNETLTVLCVFLKLTALFDSRHLDIATVSWVLIATALASCTMGVTPAVRYSSTVNRTNSTKYFYREGSSFKQMDSHSKFKVLTVVLIRIQALWDMNCVTGSVNPDISRSVVSSSSGSSNSLNVWPSSWYALTLTGRQYNSFETMEPTHPVTEQHISEDLNPD